MTPHDSPARRRRRVTLRALARGWRKRCPHCGEGQLYARWARPLPRCTQCGLVYEARPGDTWLFTILFDRVPLALLLGLVYFGIFRGHPALGVVCFVAVTAGFLWTSPNRWGVGIALHYLSRLHFRDEDDPVPPLR